MSVNSVPHAFEALDGLRGVAALAVLVYHAHDLLGGAQLIPRAYLAVDLFFLLSGFVLSHAYDRRLARGLSTLGFMRLRLERLYPAYLLGLAFAFIGFGVAIARGSSVFASTRDLLGSVPFGLLLLPTPPFVVGKATLYPLNPAAWSIFFELIANGLFAAAFAALRPSRLVLLAIVSASALVIHTTLSGSLDAGSEWSSVGGGFARVGFAFFVGVGLHRLHRSGRLRMTVPWWVPFAIVVASFIVPITSTGGGAYELCCVLFVYPLVIAVTANVPNARSRTGAFGLLGAWSYPLYILHTPLLFVLTGVVVRLFDQPVSSMRPWGGFAVVGLIVLIVAGAERWIERPILVAMRTRRIEARIGTNEAGRR